MNIPTSSGQPGFAARNWRSPSEICVNSTPTPKRGLPSSVVSTVDQIIRDKVNCLVIGWLDEQPKVPLQGRRFCKGDERSHWTHIFNLTLDLRLRGKYSRGPSDQAQAVSVSLLGKKHPLIRSLRQSSYPHNLTCVSLPVARSCESIHIGSNAIRRANLEVVYRQTRNSSTVRWDRTHGRRYPQSQQVVRA